MFEQLTKSNFYLKCKKCALLLLEVGLIRHVVSEFGVLVLPEKMSSMKDWPMPSLLHDI